MPKLCKAGQQLREQIDDDYPDRQRHSDGWIADARNTALNIYQHSSTQENIKGTAFGAFQAIVEYLDWNSHKSEATRAERVIAGKYDRLKSKALDLVTVSHIARFLDYNC